MIRKILFSIVGIIVLTGCGGGPKPSTPDKKPTVYVKSNTAEKFKDLTKETAVWNGISPFFVQDKQYMRCDMSEESIAVFAREGFEIVTSSNKADYTFDVTVLSCGQGFRAYKGNRSELPLKERALYKDFMQWVAETEQSELPKDAKEIAKLISENNPEGFKRFFDENYIAKYGQKFDYTENWGTIIRQAYGYIKTTKGVVLPNKYYGITDEDKVVLFNLHKKFEENGLVKSNSYVASMNAIGSGANLASTPRGGTMGGIVMGIGLLGSFMGAPNPTPINMFTITDNRTGKSWSKEIQFSIGQLSWNNNIDKPLYNWTIDEIPWGDLD